MARPIKQGLDYFPLDVDFLRNIKVRRIKRACGIQSTEVLIALLASIYRDDGYFLKWDNDMSFLIADEVGISEGAVTEIVNKAIQCDFFDANMFHLYGVLTSEGIQKRFFEATTRRTSVRYDARFMLITINVYKNAVNVYKNSINVADNPQSKVKESKEKERREDHASMANLTALVDCYQANIKPIESKTEEDKLISLLDDFSAEWCIKAIERAKARKVLRLNYIHGILNDWKANGYDDGKQKKAQPPSAKFSDKAQRFMAKRDQMKEGKK